jgi:hypothetical protein
MKSVLFLDPPKGPPHVSSMMRTMLSAAGVLLGGVLVMLLSGLSILWCMKSLEMTSANYEGYADAQMGIEAGWLPEWLPESATHIHESHDIDTNESFATFEFAPSDHFYSGCTPVQSAAAVFPRSEDKGRFPGLVRRSLERVHEDRSLMFFRCPGRNTRSLAIDVEARIAYVWTD